MTCIYFCNIIKIVLYIIFINRGKHMKRDVRISAIRLICTLAVVALHICQATEKLNDNIHYFTEWLNLGLVMFFCISAYLYSKKEITNVYNWYIHRYSEIAIPSLILGIITIVVFTFKGNIFPFILKNKHKSAW